MTLREYWDDNGGVAGERLVLKFTRDMEHEPALWIEDNGRGGLTICDLNCDVREACFLDSSACDVDAEISAWMGAVDDGRDVEDDA